MTIDHFFESLANQFVGQFANQSVLASLEFCLDELAAVEPLCTFDERCNNLTTNTFAIGNDGSLNLWTEVANEIDALEDATQFLEQLAYGSREFVALLAGRDDDTDHLFVSRLYLLE